MYAEVKLQTPPPTPAREFIQKVAKAAQRSEHTVRMWLAKAQPIEPLAKKPIAQVLLNKQNVTDEEITLLFQTEICTGTWHNILFGVMYIAIYKSIKIK